MDHTFDLTDLDYCLPEELIARVPAERRTDARMLVVDRTTASLTDSVVAELPDYLHPGDVLVLNQTRVLPARFAAHRDTGGLIEGLFLREIQTGLWEVMLRNAGRLSLGETLRLAEADRMMTVEFNMGQGHWRVSLDPPQPAEVILESIGRAPLPPYIHRHRERDDLDQLDRDRYQTVFSQVPGSVAAPTAGLHFSPELLAQIQSTGVSIAYVTLHVGIGTFKPISAGRIEDHDMHAEWYELSQASADVINEAKRVVAVGTTSVRVLETCHSEGVRVNPGRGQTSIFIHPPNRLQTVDSLLTNFHLPRSTLLALVMSAAGIELTRRAYQHAISNAYRFFSYGDAMLIM